MELTLEVTISGYYIV